MRYFYGFIATTEGNIIKKVLTHARFRSERVRNMCQARAREIPNVFVGAVYAKTILKHNKPSELEHIDSVDDLLKYVEGLE